MKIKYEVVNHLPALTTQEADDYIKGKEEILLFFIFQDYFKICLLELNCQKKGGIVLRKKL